MTLSGNANTRGVLVERTDGSKNMNKAAGEYVEVKQSQLYVTFETSRGSTRQLGFNLTVETGKLGSLFFFISLFVVLSLMIHLHHSLGKRKDLCK